MKIQTTRVYAEIDKALAAGYTTISEQGSSRSSKTYNTVLWLIVYALTHPNTTISICRKTLPALKGSVLRDFIEILTRLNEYNPKHFNKSELIYYFANGSWIEFFSVDDEQKLRGRKRKILYVNEANEITFLEWQQLQLRTTEFSIVDYNPSFGDDHWLNDVNREPKTYHFVTTYKDNPFLEQRVVDEIEGLRGKNESLWRIYGLGLQAQVEGLIFPDIEVIRDDEFPELDHKRWLGCDWGYTHDPTAIVEVALFGDNLYIREHCYRTHMLISDIINEMKEIPRRKIIAESADPRLNDEIRRAGFNIHEVSKFKGSVMAGITKMLEYNIKLTKSSTNTIKEFKNYTYAQDKDGKWLNEPIDAYNHAIDAVRYVILNEVLGGIPQPIDKSRIAAVAY